MVKGLGKREGGRLLVMVHVFSLDVAIFVGVFLHRNEVGQSSSTAGCPKP